MVVPAKPKLSDRVDAYAERHGLDVDNWAQSKSYYAVVLYLTDGSEKVVRFIDLDS